MAEKTLRLTQQELDDLRTKIYSSGNYHPEYEAGIYPNPYLWGLAVIIDPEADRQTLQERLDELAIRPGDKTVPPGDFVCDNRSRLDRFLDGLCGRTA